MTFEGREVALRHETLSSDPNRTRERAHQFSGARKGGDLEEGPSRTAGDDEGLFATFWMTGQGAVREPEEIVVVERCNDSTRRNQLDRPDRCYHENGHPIL